jgi:hypothetical protein
VFHLAHIHSTTELKSVKGARIRTMCRETVHPAFGTSLDHAKPGATRRNVKIAVRGRAGRPPATAAAYANWAGAEAGPPNQLEFPKDGTRYRSWDSL